MRSTPITSLRSTTPAASCCSRAVGPWAWGSCFARPLDDRVRAGGRPRTGSADGECPRPRTARCPEAMWGRESRARSLDDRRRRPDRAFGHPAHQPRAAPRPVRPRTAGESAAGAGHDEPVVRTVLPADRCELEDVSARRAVWHGVRHGRQIGLLALAAGVATHAVPFLAVMSLPLLFAAGMCLMDTLDGAFVTPPTGGRPRALYARSTTTSP